MADVMDDKIKDKIINAKKALDWEKCIKLCRQAIKENGKLGGAELYGIKLNLALALLNIKDKKNRNCREAIDIYKDLISEVKLYSDKWGALQKNIGYAYSVDISGDRDVNLFNCIKYYVNSLSVVKKGKNDTLWASINAQIGFAYMALEKEGERSEKSELAVKYFNEALTVFNKERYPEDWKEISDALRAVIGRLGRS